MASARTTRRRLVAAVATVLAVTAGAGVLASPGAVAAPVSTPAAAAAAEANLPVDAEIAGTGDTGYLTSRKDDAGNTVLEWHTYADGSVTPINTGTMGHDSNSDFVVTSNGGSSVFIRDMKAGSTWSTYFDIMSEFKPGAKLVGVVADNLYVRVPTTGDYHELWSLARVNGITKKTKLTSSFYGLDYKVVASTGRNLLVLGSERVHTHTGPRTDTWGALTSVGSGTVIDWEGRWGAGTWNQDSSGALTADYRAWVENKAGAVEFVVSGPFTRRLPMTGAMSGAVIAGITGDTLLYGIPGQAADESRSPLYALDLSVPTAVPYKLLEDYSSVAHAPDGSMLVRGATAAADGLFRIREGADGAPSATLVADTGLIRAVEITASNVPTAVSLEKPGSTVPMAWTLSRGNATVALTLTHAATGRKLTRSLPQPASADSPFTFTWDGVLDGVSAPNGGYTWSVTATPTDGVGGPATASGGFQVSRQANPHDYNDNGSTDVLARDAAGVLWRDDLFDWPSGGKVTTAKRTRLGAGWQVYNQIEAAGNLAGAPAGDLLARDGAGVLWSYLGKGDGTFATRIRIGPGWQIYNKLAAGSDVTGDGRSDLLATDTSGVLWLYKGTGSWSAPFTGRTRVGAGWQGYHQITAVGNVAGGAAGDLVARDAAGVLWLYQGNGAGNFTTRVRIGAGWNGFTHLVGGGDVTGDGRPDLIAYGPNGAAVYRATGSTTTPFAAQATTLYAGEGAKFNSVA